MSYETAAAEVARCYESACNSYDNALAAEGRHAASMAKPGENVTMPKRLSGEFRNDAAGAISAAREKALKAVQAARVANNAAMVKAPSAEATNYIMSISARDNLTEAEVKAALTSYPGHAAQSAIIAAARRSGIKVYDFAQSPEESTAAALDALEADVNKRFSLFSIEDNTPGSRSFTSRLFEASTPGRSDFDIVRDLFNA